MNTKATYLLLGLLCLIILSGIARAQVSTNYDLRWSRLASGGGERQSTTSVAQDILGQWVFDSPTSANHKIITGFFGPNEVIIFTDTTYLPIVTQVGP